MLKYTPRNSPAIVFINTTLIDAVESTRIMIIPGVLIIQIEIINELIRFYFEGVFSFLFVQVPGKSRTDLFDTRSIINTNTDIISTRNDSNVYIISNTR